MFRIAVGSFAVVVGLITFEPAAFDFAQAKKAGPHPVANEAG